MDNFINDINTDGFTILKGTMPRERTRLYNEWNARYLEIQRGHDITGKYFDRYVKDAEWANYWGQSADEHAYTIDLDQVIRPWVKKVLKDPVMYHSDVVVTTDEHGGVRPHVDTPQRFEKYAEVKDLVAVQTLTALSKFDTQTGGTGFVPGSQHEQFDIKKCYKGEYNEYFNEKCVQPTLNPGDTILWNTRVLHSAMPNHTAKARRALLVLYVERDLVDELTAIDNVFT